MKLIHCLECNDVVTLIHEVRRCYCGKSAGHYTDNVNITIQGSCEVWGVENQYVISTQKDRGEVFRIREPHYKVQRVST